MILLVEVKIARSGVFDPVWTSVGGFEDSMRKIKQLHKCEVTVAWYVVQSHLNNVSSMGKKKKIK